MALTTQVAPSDDREPDPSLALLAAAAAAAFGGVEAFRQVRYDDLPSFLKEQLRTDGMHGGRRSDSEAEAFFDQRVNAEAKGSIEGIQAVVDDPCGRARVNCRGAAPATASRSGSYRTPAAVRPAAVAPVEPMVVLLRCTPCRKWD
jgi:hypothetical protein